MGYDSILIFVYKMFYSIKLNISLNTQNCEVKKSICYEVGWCWKVVDDDEG